MKMFDVLRTPTEARLDTLSTEFSHSLFVSEIERASAASPTRAKIPYAPPEAIR